MVGRRGLARGATVGAERGGPARLKAGVRRRAVRRRGSKSWPFPRMEGGSGAVDVGLALLG